MSEEKCKCTMSISMLGDGCRYCQPQEYIERLHDALKYEEEDYIEWLEGLLEKVKDKYEIETADVLLAEINERLEELKA